MFSFSFNFSSLFLSLIFSINSSKLILFLLRVTIISSFSTCISSSQISLYFAFKSFNFSSIFSFISNTYKFSIHIMSPFYLGLPKP
ncbi:hypothetical protein ANHYDRO_00077 [Anaerococcus hydrogenalis DSM 7454]|uniref:Uncharacterized protein n=1 Tax=Anaerococcus hydrogenalis DSM 7454 TaxID=561177 RepID=B6W697_9FIRM|nr:hypothetical protein ANHYDRO_00077 [Anaerococcus hydrogenalis DSM 7454]